MQCITCNGQLEQREVQHGLHADACQQCDGVWLDLNQYQQWLLDSQVILHEIDDPSVLEVAESSPNALFCPDCHGILQKFRLSANVPVRIDRCLPCHKVWLDAAEWQLLYQQEATADLLKVLSDQGQRYIRKVETRERMANVYRQRFGADDYAQAAAMREWLQQHPQRRQILAYLSAADPYTAPAY